jgi:hypothetical protein
MASLLVVAVNCGKLREISLSQALLNLPVRDRNLRSLLGHIQRWQQDNEHTDLNSPNSSWTGKYYTTFLTGKPASWPFEAVVRNMAMPAMSVNSAVPVLNLKETRDLLARVMFFFYGNLNRTDVQDFCQMG